jgi:hypothetical protein
MGLAPAIIVVECWKGGQTYRQSGRQFRPFALTPLTHTSQISHAGMEFYAPR